MKKFEVGNIKSIFNNTIFQRGEEYFREDRILDIWYQNDQIISYIDGSEIYKVELEIDKHGLNYTSCSCPFSQNGEYDCKHIAAILCYVEKFEIPKLELSNIKRNDKQNTKVSGKLDQLIRNTEYEIKKIQNKYGFIDYHNGRYFVDLIYNLSDDISTLIKNDEYETALNLIKYCYKLISDTDMDGSNGEFQDSLSIINDAAKELFDNEVHYGLFENFALKMIENNELNDFSDSPLWAIISAVDNKEDAKHVIKTLEAIEAFNGIFVDLNMSVIDLTYRYIDQEKAIKLAYDNFNSGSVKEMLLGYLKKDRRIDEIIKILEEDVNNYIRKDMAYNRLLDAYDGYNLEKKKKQILPEVILNTGSINRYKELKKLCDIDEWEVLKKKIFENVEDNSRNILERICLEEGYTKELYSLIKNNPSLERLEYYQEGLMIHGEDLLNWYKPQIIENAKRANGRLWYKDLCKYIKKMGEIPNSEDFIYEMLEEMFIYYKSKKAFKEEIFKVLNKINKQRFEILISKK